MIDQVGGAALGWSFNGRAKRRGVRPVAEEVVGRGPDLRSSNRSTLRPATWLAVVVSVGRR